MTVHERSRVFGRRAGRRAAGRDWRILAVIAPGGGLGSLARDGLAQALPAGMGFPLGTFVINVSGCLALGVLMTFVLEVWPPRRYVRPFWGIGFLGGYTTFSTYAVETRDLLARGQVPLAAGYALGSLAAGVAAVWLGVAAGRMAVRRGGGR